ncbi:MAG: winged helix-turn-helix domain-containing protein [Gammaproteobacteria bacterium]|nr:winged helix-turn-helix domain-containing protein [Gammaproteobacteria bacterium]
MVGSSTSSRRRRRLWVFSSAEFDEASWTLRIDGQAVALEAKPLEVLHELLLRAGEVVTKDELLEAVWPGLTVVEGSLPTAISKLRKSLGALPGNAIETVPRVGYRLTGPVRIESVDSPLAPRFAFVAGDGVPGRRQWRLARPLGDSGAEDVWLAHHEKTGEARVFKFADAPDRLRALKREASLSRVVFAALGEAAPLPALLEWNFETSPYFLEYAFGGYDLIAWAAQRCGLAAIPLAERLAVAARVARAVEAIHQLGVLHKDLKPANLLIAGNEAEWAVSLADFGSGRLIDHAVLDDFGITNPGAMDIAPGQDEPVSGTLAYRAPELAGDGVPTVRSDIYSLGLMLYQLAVGDFTRSLAPGWDDDVSDPLMREDISAACNRDPASRLASAGDLAERIENLDQRRATAAAAQQQAAAMAAREAFEERRQQRRPWVLAAVVSLVAGFITSAAFGAYAWNQRNDALAARELADTSYGFVAEDVLGSVNPFQANGAQETIAEAMMRASDNIDRRYAGQPSIAARLHLALARAFYGRADFDTARSEFARSEALFAKAGEADSDEALIAQLSLAAMNSVSGQPDRLEEAGETLARARSMIGEQDGKLGFALAQAEGAYGYMADLALSESAFRRAVAIGRADPKAASPNELLKARSSLALLLMRLSRADEAEPMTRAIIADSERLRGADHPDTLVTRQHWINALSMLRQHDTALRESTPVLVAMERRLGTNHRFTLALRSVRFESLTALGQFAEAAEEARRVWQGASAQAGRQSHQALVGQTDYASALCLTDRRAEGLGIAQDALQRAKGAFGRDYPLTHAIAFQTGECLIANRRHSEAGPLLEEVDADKIISLVGQSDFGGRIDLALGEVALDAGDRPAARKYTQAAESALRESSDMTARTRLAALREAVL